MFSPWTRWASKPSTEGDPFSLSQDEGATATPTRVCARCAHDDMARQASASERDMQRRSTNEVMQAHVEPKDDLAKERSKARIDPTALSEVLAGGKDELERRRKILELIQQMPWGQKRDRYALSREEVYVRALEAGLSIWKMMQEKQVTVDDALVLRELLDLPGGLELHIGMFMPTIIGQGTEEQVKKWIEPSMSLSIIGTYAQTELGHGTYVRGLETTATYDPKRQQFLIHTPTISATKWWPGGLGKTATHCILMARLFVQGKEYGPHAFVVQLRSLEDHRPLPGIKIGDIGVKFGYPGVDNGYLQFDHVWIPRDSMLMKNASVSPDGVYTPPPKSNAKASYGTMVFVRATIVADASKFLARALTIAVRYSAVRRQTAAVPGNVERQILDYQNIQCSLFTLLASCYAMHFTGKKMMELYKTSESQRKKGDFSMLPELHAVSSALKAVCTWICSDGIETCRRCCGGHGYSLLSGLPSLFASYVQNVTWEGDNNVLCLQTARYLLKAYRNVERAGKNATGSAAYFSNLMSGPHAYKAKECVSDWTFHDLEAVLQQRCLLLCREADAELCRLGLPNGYSGPCWDGYTVTLIRVARAHGIAILYSNFVAAIQDLEERRSVSYATLITLWKLSRIFALECISSESGEFIELGCITSKQASLARKEFFEALNFIRDDAVALVDAFAIPDYLLNSALGRSDGDVYKGLLDMAEASRLNQTEVGPAYHDLLAKVLNKGRVASQTPSKL